MQRTSTTDHSPGSRRGSGAERVATPMRVRDSRAVALFARRWTFGNEDARALAVSAWLGLDPTAPGLIRHSLFQDIDDLSLFDLSQWSDVTARDTYVSTLSVGSSETSEVADDQSGIACTWLELASPYRSYVSETDEPAGCLVVVRQPMKQASSAIARDWVDRVLLAIESGTARAEGLIAATFLIGAEGNVVLNLAEWINADAHRRTLQPAQYARHGSLGDSPEWRAVREHPGVEPNHEVRRYELIRTFDR